jgi:mono/diheme cytochrome c family protein
MSVHTPIESRPGVPRWAIGLFVFVVLVGGVYAGSNLSGTNPPIAVLPSASAGPGGGGVNAAAAMALIGKAGCQNCHGQDLSGQASFPDLHGLQNGPTVANLQALYKAHPSDWANIWITGTDAAVSDPAFRKGMPAFGGPPYNLTADQIDTIVKYVLSLK